MTKCDIRILSRDPGMSHDLRTLNPNPSPAIPHSLISRVKISLRQELLASSAKTLPRINMPATVFNFDHAPSFFVNTQENTPIFYRSHCIRTRCSYTRHSLQFLASSHFTVAKYSSAWAVSTRGYSSLQRRSHFLV